MRAEHWIPDQYHNRMYDLVQRIPALPFQKLLFRRELRRRAPVVIFQFGKVGSLAIHHSLGVRFGGVVLHTHNLAADDPSWKTKEIFRLCKDRTSIVNVISLTRDPIGQNISAFFQNFERATGLPLRRARCSLPEIRTMFLENHNHSYPLCWFDSLLKPALGIDVYGRPFPTEGHAIYRQDNIRLLVIQSELPDEKKCAVLGSFLQLDNLHIDRSNQSDNKSYGELYRHFLNEVKLPQGYLNKMCSSKYFRHFYSREYIETIRQRWNNLPELNLA